MSTLRLKAEQVRRICAARGLETDQAFAEAIGVNKGTASRVLNGQAPGPKFISSLLTSLPVKFEDVFDIVDEHNAQALAAEHASPVKGKAA